MDPEHQPSYIEDRSNPCRDERDGHLVNSTRSAETSRADGGN